MARYACPGELRQVCRFDASHLGLAEPTSVPELAEEVSVKIPGV